MPQEDVWGATELKMEGKGVKKTSTAMAKKICILLAFVLLLSGAGQAVDVRTAGETNPRTLEPNPSMEPRLIGTVETEPFEEDNPPLDPYPDSGLPYLDEVALAPPLDSVYEEDGASIFPEPQLSPPLDPRDGL